MIRCCPYGPLLVCVALLEVSACQRDAGPVSRGNYQGPINHCKQDNTCEHGGYCHPSLGICAVRQTMTDRSVYVRIAPKEARPQVFPVEITDKGQAEVAIDKLFEVGFKVQTRARPDDAPFNVKADIYIIDEWTIPGETPRIVTTAVSEKNSTSVVELGTGEARYSIRVVPKDITESAPPPGYWENVSVVTENCLMEEAEACLVDDTGYELSLLMLSGPFREIEGEIFAGPQSLSGLRVEALAVDTDRVISTPAITGCPLGSEPDELCGYFKVKMYGSDFPEDGGYPPFRLRIVRDGDPFYPVTIVESGNAEVEDDYWRFDLPALASPVRFEGRVDGKMMLESGDVVHDGVPGCLLVFDGVADDDESGTQMRMRLNAMTDNAGNIVGVTDETRVYLYPGDYELSILPPSVGGDTSVAYGVVHKMRTIDGSSPVLKDQVFELPFRLLAKGRVVLGEEGIPGSRVQAFPYYHEFPYATHQFATPLGGGAFSVWLDSGPYVFIAEVPSDVGLAYQIYRTTIGVLDGADTPVEIPLTDFEPPFPVVVTLDVTDVSTSGMDLQGVEVTWYEAIDETSSILVGRSSLDAEGKSVGLLPPLEEVLPLLKK